MTKVVLISEEGTPCISSSDDQNLVSELEPNKAVETWQVGFVNSKLSITHKTIASKVALLNESTDGDLIEVTYKPVAGDKLVGEVQAVQHFGDWLQPELISIDESPSLTDEKIVQQLEALWGEYITVTYRRTSHGEDLLKHKAAPWPLELAYR